MALRPSSVKDYQLLLNKHILPTIGTIPLAELDTIPPHVMPMVTDHVEKHVERRGEGLLFYDRHGRNLRPADFQAARHAARAAAGRDDLKFHHLRHTGRC
jgi:hypothetical protein